MKPMEPDPILQGAALARWSQCVEQFGNHFEGSMSALWQTADSVCDGHRRDVLATYPLHMENQVDSILSERARIYTTRLVKTGIGKLSLHEARQDDL